MTFISLIPPIYVNVKQYGAVGDGVTNDTIAIQAAINASSVGSTVFFPAGTYMVNATIQLLAGRQYLGTSGVYQGSTIKQMNGSNLPAVVASSDWYGTGTSPFTGNPLTIEHLFIDGNISNNTTSVGLAIMNYDSAIRWCWVVNTPSHGILVSSVNRGNHSTTNTSVEDRIVECKVSNTGGHGIYCQDTGGKLTDGYIDSCIVDTTTQDGIHLDRASGWFLRKNHVYGAGFSAYALSNCWATSVIGNEVDGYGTSATTGFYSGIACSLIGPRSTVIMGNIIGSSEPTSGTHYRHLSVTGAGATDTHAIIMGNIIEGGWDVSPNNPTNGTAYSLGLDLEVNGTQTGSGQPCTMIISGNRADNVGTNFIDAYITQSINLDGTAGTLKLPSSVTSASVSTSGDVTVGTTSGNLVLDGHITASSGVTGVPTLAALTANGSGAPTPTFSLIGGTDVRGKINIGSGTSQTAGNQVSVTFARPYVGNPPVFIVGAGNAATAALLPYVDNATVDVTGFNIAFTNAPSASQSRGTYVVSFMAIG